MKYYLPLMLIALVLFLLAASVSGTLLIHLYSLPENPEEMGEAIGRGLSLAISVIFFAIAAGVEVIATVLGEVGALVAKRTGASRKTVITLALLSLLPLLFAALPFLLIPR